VFCYDSGESSLQASPRLSIIFLHISGMVPDSMPSIISLIIPVIMKNLQDTPQLAGGRNGERGLGGCRPQYNSSAG